MVQFRKWLMQEMVGDRQYMATMGFGKHKGKHHTQVPGGYLRWALDNTGQFNSQDRAEIEDYLKRPRAAQPATPAPVQPTMPTQQPVQPTQASEPTDFQAQGYRLITAKYNDRQGRYKAGDKIWYHPETKATHPSQATAPQATAPQATPQPTQLAMPGEWYCANVVGTDERVVLKPKNPRNPEGDWEFQELDETGQITSGTIDFATLKSGEFVKSVDDPAVKGGKKRVNDPMEWLSDTPAAPVPPAETPVNQDNGPVMTAGGRPSPEKVKIPPQHMTEYNRAIEQKFVGTQDNIMIDALAGTGKTTS